MSIIQYYYENCVCLCISHQTVLNVSYTFTSDMYVFFPHKLMIQ